MNLLLISIQMRGQRDVVSFVAFHRIWVADCPTLIVFVAYKRLPVVAGSGNATANNFTYTVLLADGEFDYLRCVLWCCHLQRTRGAEDRARPWADATEKLLNAGRAL